MRRSLLFYCQHVLGMGHFVRSTAIARGLAADFDVHFINGGEIVPGFELPASIDVIQLPAIRSDADFHDLHAVDDGQSLEEIKEIRRRLLIDVYARVRPDVLVVELFPFGRRKFGFELIPLLDCVRADGGQTKVVCSLRDILVTKSNPERFEEEVCRIVNLYFDLVLVHADPRLQLLDETFHRVGDLNAPVRYTGFVAEENTDPLPASLEDLPDLNDGKKLIVVSLGGGRVGGELIDCALDAVELLNSLYHLFIFTGPYFPSSDFDRLSARTVGNPRITLRRYTTQFSSYLAAADLSLSMAGYNTCLNLVATGVRAIVYPFTGGGDSEQSLRAGKLKVLGLIDVISAEELTAARLAGKISHLLAGPRPGVNAAALDLGGVGKTAEIIAALKG